MLFRHRRAANATILAHAHLHQLCWLVQPAQPQAQPPIVINNNPTPQDGFWAGVLKLAIPTILGAGLGSYITLYGLRENNKHNAAENKANRESLFNLEIAKAEIAAKYKSQDRRWEFRNPPQPPVLSCVTMHRLALIFFATTPGARPAE
jgi:hypothetical protein